MPDAPQVSPFSKPRIPRLHAVESVRMHSAVAEEIHQSGEYHCSQKEADDGPDIARFRSDRRVGGVQRVWKIRISNWHRACATGPELGRAGGKTYFAVYQYFHVSGTKLTG